MMFVGCGKDTTPNPIFKGLGEKYFIVIISEIENYTV